MNGSNRTEQSGILKKEIEFEIGKQEVNHDAICYENESAIDRRDIAMSGAPLILSLRPGPYARLSEGTKLHEFRRRFPDEATLVFLYLSAPISAVAAYAEFGRPIVGTPEELAAIAEKDEAGSYADTLDYFKGLSKGYALPLLSLREIEPMPLTELRDTFGFRPPLSYRRVEAGSLLERELKKKLEMRS